MVGHVVAGPFVRHRGVVGCTRVRVGSPLFCPAASFVGWMCVGCFLLAFDRSKEKCNRYHRHPHDSGTIDINIRSRANLTSTVTVIIYATYSSEILIDDTDTVEVVKNF